MGLKSRMKYKGQTVHFASPSESPVLNLINITQNSFPFCVLQVPIKFDYGSFLTKLRFFPAHPGGSDSSKKGEMIGLSITNKMSDNGTIIKSE